MPNRIMLAALLLSSSIACTSSTPSSAYHCSIHPGMIGTVTVH
jgi:plastocyanin